MALYEPDAQRLVGSLVGFCGKHAASLPDQNEVQHVVRKEFDLHADASRGLIKQVDLLYKLSARVADVCSELAQDEAISDVYDRRATGRLVKRLNEERKAAVEQLKLAAYYHRQAVWLQDRFPNAELTPVPGLVKVIDLKDIRNAIYEAMGLDPAPPADKGGEAPP